MAKKQTHKDFKLTPAQAARWEKAFTLANSPTGDGFYRMMCEKMGAHKLQEMVLAEAVKQSGLDFGKVERDQVLGNFVFHVIRLSFTASVIDVLKTIGGIDREPAAKRRTARTK